MAFELPAAETIDPFAAIKARAETVTPVLRQILDRKVAFPGWVNLGSAVGLEGGRY